MKESLKSRYEFTRTKYRLVQNPSTQLHLFLPFQFLLIQANRTRGHSKFQHATLTIVRELDKHLLVSSIWSTITKIRTFTNPQTNTKIPILPHLTHLQIATKPSSKNFPHHTPPKRLGFGDTMQEFPHAGTESSHPEKKNSKN